jgi:hypothetical protein
MYGLKPVPFTFEGAGLQPRHLNLDHKIGFSR